MKCMALAPVEAEGAGMTASLRACNGMAILTIGRWRQVAAGGGWACLSQRLDSLVADERLLDGREQLERLEQSRCVRRTAHVLDEVT